MNQYWPAQPDDPSGITVASVIEFSICSLWVLCMYVTNFLILSSKILGRHHVIAMCVLPNLRLE